MNTTPQIENEGIIRKIQRLLALGQSPNEAEANLAMAKAQELLAKHNLEMAMVTDAVVAGGTTQAAPEKREKARISRSAQYQWQRNLWKAIAEANFCWHSIVEVYDGKRGEGKRSKVPVKRHMIIGRESNVIAVRLMGEYLEDTMERLLITVGGFSNQERLGRSAISWKTGCADRLVERIEAQAEERKRESDATRPEGTSTSTAIVLRDVYQSEYQANYDCKYGEGAWARKLLRDAEWEAGQAERQAKAEAERIQAEKEWLEYLQTETPEQKKAREKEEAKQRLREARASERMWRSWERQRRAEARKTDSRAYDAGNQAGSNISLNAQVAEGRTRKDRSIS